ncbi:MAG: hypothetical protein IJ849_12650 [Selenomonadaceae bacterium]|nr:hypothetical protein [Selenomonadaceae bacterium]
MSGKREYGDYQTPVYFADRVCAYLRDYRQINPSAVVEPTCGIGNFLESSLIFEANEYYGIDINQEYCSVCQTKITDSRVKIINADFFAFSSKGLIQDKRQILIIGNPPWVTNSTLSVLDSENLPIKTNFKRMKGLDAITGAGNFDICEYIILQLISEYRNTNTVIAMLCKTSVARNVFQELKRTHVNFSSCDMLNFDTSKVFGINAKGCVLIIQLSDKMASPDVCNVYDLENPETIRSKFGYSSGQFYSKLDIETENFNGYCQFEWRQGVKHDCAKVMELTLCNGVLQNGQKKEVHIENSFVYPLIKSSMFKAPIINCFSKYVIVTQKKNARRNSTSCQRRTENMGVPKC